MILLLVTFISITSFSQSKEIENVIKKYSSLLNVERKTDGGWDNKMILDVLLELYPNEMKGYPSKSTIDFFNKKCKNLYADKKMQIGIWNSYTKSEMNAYYLKMVFMKMGLTTNEAELLSKYIDNKKYINNSK